LTKFDEIGEIQDVANFWTKFTLFDERKMAFWWQNFAEI